MNCYEIHTLAIRSGCNDQSYKLLGKKRRSCVLSCNSVKNHFERVEAMDDVQCPVIPTFMGGISSVLGGSLMMF